MLAACLLLPITIALTDLFVQLDSRLPNGDYRIPGLIATPNGTLLAFVMGRMHRTDATPNLVYLRRSFDDGASWDEARAILSDPKNAAAAVFEPSTPGFPRQPLTRACCAPPVDRTPRSAAHRSSIR